MVVFADDLAIIAEAKDLEELNFNANEPVDRSVNWMRQKKNRSRDTEKT